MLKPVIGGKTPGMEIALALRLPRDRLSVSVARHIMRYPGPEGERGRGLLLMTALTDRVRFTTRPHDGTVVSMEKNLVYTDRSLLEPGRPSNGSGIEA